LPDADLQLLLSAVREAGQRALAMQAEGYNHRQKRDGTFVTDIDIAVDDLLRNRVARELPDDGWLSEETTDMPTRLQKRRLWIADPIDGTRGLLKGTGPWGIGMALVEDGELRVAAILRPADDLLFHAIQGGGCFLNGLPVRTAPQRNVITAKRYRETLFRGGFSPETDSPIPLLLRLSSIAQGQHGAAISMGDKNDWDIAAGHLLVAEAGGIVTNLAGGPIVYNQPQPWQPGLVAAADMATHAAILDIVRDT
jgi:myo-inositol-1(or 4)-monophosphatase